MFRKSLNLGVATLGLAMMLGGPAHAEETFKLGFLGGLTGYLAPYDQPSLDGLTFGVDEINKAGGLQGKYKIELVSRDMRSETAESAVIAQELAGAGVNFLVVPCDVDPAVAAGQISAAAGIPTMSSCASTPTLPGIVGEYMFSNYTADNLQAAALGDYAMKQGYKNAFVMLSKDTPYTQKLPEYFVEVFKKKGGSIAGIIEYKMGQQDFAAEVTKIKGLSPAPDVIMTSAYEPDFPAFIKALRAAGITTPVLGSDGIDSPTTLALGDVAEGVVFTNAGFATEGSALAKFFADYKAAKGKEPETLYVATGYDIVKVLDAAVGASQGKLDGKSLRDAVDGLENVAVATGTMTYKGMNRVPLRTVALNKVTGGARALVELVTPAAADVPAAQ
ncbi:ABC transporter substrate-binding protein [Taklimakanibacter lacteus]|uniref:ABC transporter substrate-binding protein n=1 Tax=Taklimakanibacter lacteus TaxID=2268456 RepID=UPI000E65F13D